MNKRLTRLHAASLLLVLLLLAACDVPTPTVTPIAPTPTQPDQKSIEALVVAMQDAVVSGDKKAYLSHVDLTDPVFALEHTRWADGWSKEPPKTFVMYVKDIGVTGPSATATLTIGWNTEAKRVSERSATLPVRFNRQANGEWRFAGEAWVSFETEYFVVRAVPGLANLDRDLVPELPEVYEHVTGSLGYTLTHKPEIKLYDDPTALVAMTLLKLPDSSGWNEPGEALKLATSRDQPVYELRDELAHELTHYATFDRAGTAHTRMPWWLDEGLADYVAAGVTRPEVAERRLQQVREWAKEGDLADWDSISDFETTPVDMWTYVYPQGYAMVRYITETFGEEKRNRWLAAMATEMDINQATSEMLGLTFDDLGREFVAWLKKEE
jgi:hypothetical protein